MEDVVLITPPSCEPVSLAAAKKQCNVDFTDDDALFSEQIIPAACAQIETETRRVLLKQEWMLKLDGFPGVHPKYATAGYPSILLPKPPFQSIVSFAYTDTAGNMQELVAQTEYGFAHDLLLYGYRLDPGSETQPARLMPPWARPWPPGILVGSNVKVDFWCGYCDAAYVSIRQDSLDVLDNAVFSGADDGKRIYIPGAGPARTTLVAKLAVETSGEGTIAPPASQAVTNALAFLGGRVPPELLQAILLQVAYLYTQRGDSFDASGPLPELAPGVLRLIGPYINRVA